MRGAHEYLLTEGKNEGIKKLKKKKGMQTQRTIER